MAKNKRPTAEEQCEEVIAQNKRLFQTVEQLNVRIRDLTEERDRLIRAAENQAGWDLK